MHKIFCYDDDPRRFADDYFYNKGSFAQITDGLNIELKKRGILGDEQTATDVGFASGLKLDFGFNDRKTFLIHVFETNQLPHYFLGWRSQTKTKVFGLSKQIADLWNSYGFPTDIVDIGVDPEFWKPMPEIPKFDKFTILSTTSCNFRSHVPELLTAFEIAFEHQPDVRLIIKNTDDRAYKLPSIVETIRYQGFSVDYICERWSALQLRNLMAKCHVLVYAPTTSAGIPILEAGAMELPVIVGNHCPTNIYPTCAKIECLDRPIAEIKEMVVKQFGLPYTFPEGMIDENKAIMHCPNVMDFAKKLSSMKKNYDRVKSRATEVRNEIVKGWTWSHSCDQLLKGLGYVL